MEDSPHERPICAEPAAPYHPLIGDRLSGAGRGQQQACLGAVGQRQSADVGIPSLVDEEAFEPLGEQSAQAPGAEEDVE